MKKLLFIAAMLLYSVAYSQNLIGHSARDIYTQMYKKGYIVERLFTKDGTPYIKVAEDSGLKAYYINSNNECYSYLLVIYGATLDELTWALNKNNYYKSGDYFYDENYKADLQYNTDFNEYVIVFTQK